MSTTDAYNEQRAITYAGVYIQESRALSRARGPPRDYAFAHHHTIFERMPELEAFCRQSRDLPAPEFFDAAAEEVPTRLWLMANSSTMPIDWIDVSE